MIDSKILPAHILRLYVWELVKQEGVMETVNGLVPIIPVEDEPKVADANKAYGIYGYSENDSRGVEEIREGIFSVRLIAPTFSQLGEITNVISTAFESSNISTEAVNRFSSNFSNPDGLGGPLTGIRFTYTKLRYVEGGEAADTEGGPMDGVVNIAYRYITHLPIPIVNSARGGLWS